MASSIRILGLPFFHESLEKALEYSENGGLFVFPSGPCLAEADTHKAYYQALEKSDFLLVDSGFLSLVWRCMTGIHLKRISGYQFLKAFLQNRAFRNSQSYCWVMPSTRLMHTHLQWLKTQGIQANTQQCYVAPDYTTRAIEDEALLKLIQYQKPKYIIIALGGGVQEKLGAFLKQNLDYQPTILCIGAALAFLSGAQVYIPDWADRAYLGWLFRVLSHPSLYFKRYFKAWRLVKLLLKYKEKSPF